jgi:hypothetical protein
MIPRRAWAGYLILMLSLATVAEAGSSKIELRRDNTASQEATNMKTSCWIDYSNTVGGVTEGVAMFQWPDGKEHRWLTREYGTFGPRRQFLRAASIATATLGSGRIPLPKKSSRAKIDGIDLFPVRYPTTGQFKFFNGLTYRFGDQLKEGVDLGQTRSCYIHPLFSLAGQVLTDDFPEDHLHHHGLFWAWPIVKTRSENTQTWQPSVPSLRQHFVRWLKREAGIDGAILSVENVWELDQKETVAAEIVAVWIHQADRLGRAIDLELEIEAVGGPLGLQGTPDQNKGYGGLCLRGAAMFKGAALTTFFVSPVSQSLVPL